MRNSATIFCFFMLGAFTANAQTSVRPVFVKNYSPESYTILYRMGESIVPVNVMQYGGIKDRVYINLHSDEVTAVMAAKALLEKEGGLFIRIENNNKRNIRFSLRGRYYSFDPNRIFSRTGIIQTLGNLGRISEPAINEVEKFAARILQLIPENPACIIALHNNTDGKFGINSYLPGAERETDARQVYVDSLQDNDDIFLTTDSKLYDRLSSEKFNTILQGNQNARKDGSLSIYCGERNISYLNCETQHGKNEQYSMMLLSATAHITHMNAFITWSYALQPGSIRSFSSGKGIYFGEKKIGEIRSVNNDSTQGLLEIEKRFRLYSNMDLFLVQKLGGDAAIELRVDPTREKEPVDPNRTTLLIAAGK